MKNEFITEVNTTILDFETASLEPDAGIISIGGFHFNRFSVSDTEKAMNSEVHNFYINVDLTEQFFLGCHLDQGTALWWNTYNNDQIKNVLKNKVSIYKAMELFIVFLKMNSTNVFFSRRTHADYIWLKQICKKLDMKNPIGHNQIFDVATAIMQTTGEIKGHIKTEKNFDMHNALGDCHRDALQLAMINDKEYTIPEHLIKGK